jgi:hypothetical protein
MRTNVPEWEQKDMLTDKRRDGNGEGNGTG